MSACSPNPLTTTWTPGNSSFSRSSVTIRCSSSVATPGFAVTISSRDDRPARCVRRTAESSASTTGPDSLSSVSPASVSASRGPERSNRSTPRRCSSWRIARDSGGWAIPRRSAARVMFSSSATARKYGSSRISGSGIPPGYGRQPDRYWSGPGDARWTGTMNQNEVGLVTGGNKGIGREIVRQLGLRGLTVYLAARNPELGRAAAAELKDEGLDVRFVQLAVTDVESVDAAAKQVEADSGRLDVLVNNAGIVAEWRTSVADITAEQVCAAYDVNV